MRRSHRTLDVWKDGVALVGAVYRATASFPSSETYGLTSQMRRAAVSVPANIAQGFARQSTRELLQFLAISAASLSGIDTLIELAARLRMLEHSGRL